MVFELARREVATPIAGGRRPATVKPHNSLRLECSDDLLERAVLLRRFREETKKKRPSSVNQGLDLDVLAINGYPPPPTFISETERFEWARLRVDVESRIPSIVCPEDMSLEAELAEREEKKARCRQEKYVDHLLQISGGGTMDEYHLKQYEDFRRFLVKVLKRGLKQHVHEKGLMSPEESPSFSLGCIGSLRYGLALESSTMDLVFTPKRLPPEVRNDMVTIAQRLLIDQGLVVVRTDSWNPATPVLRVASSDNFELVETHMQESKRPDIPYFDEDLADYLFARLGSSGCRCSIFFPGDQLPEHSADLLQCCTLCDRRVKTMGLFIKKWARARNICCPREGTLSPSAYLYLVVHYLRDVADPPVLPNLYDHEGERTRYWGDKGEIAAARDEGGVTENKEAVATLLRGFFEYFCGKSPEARCTPRKTYFSWAGHSIALGSDGGRVARGRGPPRRGDLARIEDALDARRNLAACVTYDGLERMRDEFARARLYVENATLIPSYGWGWTRRDGSVGRPFFEPVQSPPPRRGAPQN